MASKNLRNQFFENSLRALHIFGCKARKSRFFPAGSTRGQVEIMEKCRGVVVPSVDLVPNAGELA